MGGRLDRGQEHRKELGAERSAKHPDGKRRRHLPGTRRSDARHQRDTLEWCQRQMVAGGHRCEPGGRGPDDVDHSAGADGIDHGRRCVGENLQPPRQHPWPRNGGLPGRRNHPLRKSISIWCGRVSRSPSAPAEAGRRRAFPSGRRVAFARFPTRLRGPR